MARYANVRVHGPDVLELGRKHRSNLEADFTNI